MQLEGGLSERLTSKYAPSEGVASTAEEDQCWKHSLAGPIFLLRMIGIPACKKNSRVPFYIICSLLWVLFVAIVIYDVVNATDLNISAAASNAIWMLHATVIYTAVGFSMCSDYDLLSLMKEMAADEDDPMRSADTSVDLEQMRRRAWMSTVCTAVFATANIVAVSIAFFNGYFYEFFPVVRSQIWLAAMICLWYFYSFGSVLSIPFVYIPAVTLLGRVSKLVSHIEARGADDDDLLNDFNRFTAWYDNLYKANKRLNMHISLLVTVNIGLCAPLTVFELLVAIDGSLRGMAIVSGIIWVLLNTFLLGAVCSTIARIEALKNKIKYGIGELSLAGRSDSALVHFNCMLSKVDANPLGIVVYGTTLRISSNNILKVLSVVVSLFFFFIGLRTGDTS